MCPVAATEPKYLMTVLAKIYRSASDLTDGPREGQDDGRGN
jgi:hypothetical protein